MILSWYQEWDLRRKWIDWERICGPDIVLNQVVGAQLYISFKQLLAPSSPTLKHACLLCTFGCVSTAFPLIQTNQKPYSLAHINGSKLFLPHPLSTYLTLAFWSNNQSWRRHGFKSHVQCSHYSAVEGLSFTSCSAGTEVRSYFNCDSWWSSLAPCRPKDRIQDVCLGVQMPPRSRSRVPVGAYGDCCYGCWSSPPTIGGAWGFDYSSITNKNFRTASFRDSWSAELE